MNKRVLVTAGQLGNHLNMQPVITLSPDGQSGNVRSRLLQQLSFNANPSMGAAVYENAVVNEISRQIHIRCLVINTRLNTAPCTMPNNHNGVLMRLLALFVQFAKFAAISAEAP